MKRSAKNGFAIHRATLPSAKESGNLDDSGQVSARTTWLDNVTPLEFYDVPQHVTSAVNAVQGHFDETLRS